MSLLPPDLLNSIESRELEQNTTHKLTIVYHYFRFQFACADLISLLPPYLLNGIESGEKKHTTTYNSQFFPATCLCADLMSLLPPELLNGIESGELKQCDNRYLIISYYVLVCRPHVSAAA